MLRHVAAASILALVWCSTARADEAEVEETFREAQARFDERRYAEALVLFQEVYESFKSPAILFNIAQTHRNLGDWAQAAAQFRRYLRRSPGAANADAVSDTVRQLDRLIEAVGHVRQRRYRQALEIYDQVGARADLPVLERDIGRAHERLGEYREAIAAYRRYLEALPAAPDAADIGDDIDRLEVELSPAAPAGSAPGDDRPAFYKRWWFWGSVAAVVVAGGVTAVALSGGPPDSTLGNIGFDR